MSSLVSSSAPSHVDAPRFARLRLTRRRSGVRRSTTFAASSSARGCADELSIIADRFESNTS